MAKGNRSTLSSIFEYFIPMRKGEINYNSKSEFVFVGCVFSDCVFLFY